MTSVVKEIHHILTEGASMPVQDDDIAACVSHYRALLDAAPQPPTSLSQTPDSRLDVIIGKAGAKRRTAALLARLADAFTDAGITTFPPLTDADLDAKERVYFFDAQHPIEALAPMRQLFRDEQTLQAFIWTHRDWFADLRKLGLYDFEEQASLDSGRRVDFLCKRRRSKELVGIELKVREPDDRAVGQLQQYLEDLQAHAQRHGFDSAHLILIAGQPDLSVRTRVEQFAAARGLSVTFLLYRVHMKLHPHP